MHPLLRSAAQRQHGIVTAADARRAGYDHGEVRHLCASGQWRRLRRGIYVPADELARAEQEGRRHQLDCLAVLLSLDRPTAAISHGSAALLWGFPRRRSAGSDIQLTDPTHGRSGTAFHVYRAPLDAEDLAVRGPFRFTTAARTLVDCARADPLEDAVVAMDAAVLAGLTSPAQLLAVAERQRSWRGAQRARRAIELSDGRAESPLETRGRLRIVGAGLPAPELQVEIRVAGRLIAVVDGWFDEAAVALEMDGRVKYTDPWRGRTPERVLWDEKRREDKLRALDIRVVRLTDADLGQGWTAAESRLHELLAVPGPDSRRFTATPRQAGRKRAG